MTGAMWVLDRSGAELAPVASGPVPSRSVAAKVLGRVRSPKFAEGLHLSARLMGDLPLAPSVALHVLGVPGVVRIEFDAERAHAARAEGDLVIDAEEWRAIALGAEADRVWPSDFAALCRRKQGEPSWRIDTETALAGAQPDAREEWSAARVLERIGADVLSIELPV